MKIEKIYQTQIDKSKVMAEKTESDINTYSCNYVNEQLDKKVPKEEGKGLSSNDFTTTLKNKLDGIADNATKNVVEDNLASTSTTNALSAAQGKALNDNKLGKTETAASANYVKSRGTITPETGANPIAVSGISMQNAYNNGYPTTYGNVLNLAGGGRSQLYLGWEGGNITSSTSQQRGRLFYRSLRDYVADGTVWSSWGQIFTVVSLYDNTSGTTGTVTLSETAANFSILEIICLDNDGEYFSNRIYGPNNKNARLFKALPGNKTLYVKGKGIKISGTSITVSASEYQTYTENLTTWYSMTSNFIKIVKVFGYR